MIITNVMRILLGQQLRPFQFKKDIGFLPDYNVPNFGLYVHIPFCKDICPFCPYYKIKYSSEYTKMYLNALLTEIELAANKVLISDNKRHVTSLYLGGGSPALMINDLPKLRNAIDKYFIIDGNAGIELHPRDVKESTAEKLIDSGFNMISIGIQSFKENLLSCLKRDIIDTDKIFSLLTKKRFKGIDIDLIFGIPGQSEKDLRDDFLKAADIGATQISTYPFIDFSYAENRVKPQGHSGQKNLLSTLLETAEKTGFKRTSVWTFGRKDAPHYSSITRDCFLGFGPSAASLGLDAFKVNTFSFEAYIETVNNKIIPTALKMRFTKRTRKLYWLFWNCYNGTIYKKDFKKLFSSELRQDFSLWLKLGTVMKLLQKMDYGWELTDLGSYYFHWVEQRYTHQYIDKTWRLAMVEPWPNKISLY